MRLGVAEADLDRMPPRSPECTVPVIEWLPFDSEKGPLTWENSVCDSCRVPTRRVGSRWRSSPPRGQLDSCFDDTRAIANAGLLAATLAERLGIEQAAD